MDPSQFDAQAWARAVALNNARTGRAQPYGGQAPVADATPQNAQGGVMQAQLDAMDTATSPLVQALAPKPAEAAPDPGGYKVSEAMPGAKLPGQSIAFTPPGARGGEPPLPAFEDYRRNIEARAPWQGNDIKFGPSPDDMGFGGAAQVIDKRMTSKEIADSYEKLKTGEENKAYANKKLGQEGALAAAQQAIALRGQDQSAAQALAQNELGKGHLANEKLKTEQFWAQHGLMSQAEINKAIANQSALLGRPLGAEEQRAVADQQRALAAMIRPNDGKPIGLGSVPASALPMGNGPPLPGSPSPEAVIDSSAKILSGPGADALKAVKDSMGRAATGFDANSALAGLANNPAILKHPEAMRNVGLHLNGAGLGPSEEIKRKLQEAMVDRAFHVGYRGEKVGVGKHVMIPYQGGPFGGRGFTIQGPNGSNAPISSFMTPWGDFKKANRDRAQAELEAGSSLLSSLGQ